MPLIQILADPESLFPNPWNTNVVPPDNEAKLDESVKRLGMFKPVVVRELANGTLQILGGEHRAASAKRVGLKQIPVINLGKVDDKRAKEISLIDNGRYGSDNTLELAALLDELGTADELAKFMPYTDADLASIFSSVSIALDDLDLPEIEETPTAPSRDKPAQTHQIMRFKVPVDDVDEITRLIEKTMKVQGFSESDSLTNAGDALVFLLKKQEA